MTEQGAITLAIEALQEAYDGNVSPGVDDSVLREALEALEAFRDGPAPCVKGLTLGSDLEGKISESDAVKLVNSVIVSLWEIMMGKAEVADDIDGDLETKHIQDAIK